MYSSNSLTSMELRGKKNQRNVKGGGGGSIEIVSRILEIFL